MHLLLRREQHEEEGWLSTSTIFELDGRLDLDEEERFMFDKYELVIWNASSSHYIMARISIEESACGECRCERPAN